MPSRNEVRSFVVAEGTSPIRVDKYCASQPGIARSIFDSKDTVILVNGKSVKKSRIVSPGEHLSISYTISFFDGAEPEDIPLDVLHEDDDMLVINKKQGMVVHPAAGNWDGTLVSSLLFRYGKAFVDEDEEGLRPGIVHRLDKDTSGTMVIARNRKAHENLARQFQEHTVSKTYIAIAKGRFGEREGRLVTGMRRSFRDRKKFCVCEKDEGKIADTEYRVLRQFADCALLSVQIHTGRTHQIRVHLSSIGHAIVGDPIYGNGNDGTTLLLHSKTLCVDSPTTGKRMRFSSPMPQRFKDWIIPRLSKANVLSR